MFYDIEKFVDLVKERPPLYNLELIEHRDKRLVERLWNEIGAEFQTSADECRGKWQVLRSNYGRYLKSVQQATLYPETYTKKKQWHLAHKMEFLRKFLRQFHTRRNCNIFSVSNDETSSTTLSTWEAPIEDNPTKDDDAISIVSLDSDSSAIEISDTEEPSVKERYTINNGVESSQEYQSNEVSHSNYRAGTSRQTSTEFENFTCSKRNETYTSLSPNKRYKTPSEDEIVKFFEGILPDIDKLSEKGIRLFKQEILLVLNQSLDEQENELLS